MISIGLIGCGDVAEYGHAPTIQRHDRFRLAAVCDLNRERAELLAARAGGVPIYTDWRELVAREQLDAAVLALPPEVSPEVVAECLRHQLAVLDEKPLAASLADGRRLAKMVAESDCVYQVGFVLRYGDWVREIRRLTATFGSPLKIRVEVYDERLDPNNTVHFSRIQQFLKNSSALTHEGSHVIDYVNLWNPAEWTSVSAFAQQTQATFAGPNVWNAQVELADLSTLYVKVAWLLPELPHSTIAIEGPAGRLHFDCVTGQAEYEVEAEQRIISLPPVAAEWNRQYDAFANAIERGVADFATASDALRALEVTAACELSANTAKVVTRGEFQRQAVEEPVDPIHGPSPTPNVQRSTGASRTPNA
jgi:predicted dehydrogenase